MVVYFVSGFWVGVAVGVAASVVLWLWVRLARAAGAIANRRGYPRLAGLAAGLLTGPLAIVTSRCSRQERACITGRSWRKKSPLLPGSQ